MEDWTQHELKILIEHHMKHAREMMEIANMLGDEDGIDGKEFVVFARARLKRAMELRRKLIGDYGPDSLKMPSGYGSPSGEAK